MPKKKKKEITTEDLAQMIAKGFTETASQKSVDALERDVNVLKQDVASIDKRLTRVEAKLDRALYKEMARLEDLIRQLARKTKVTLEY